MPRGWMGRVVGLMAPLVAMTPFPALAEDPPAAAAPAAAAPAVPAPSVPAAPAIKPPMEAAAGTPATVIDEKQIESVLGRPVLSPTGEDLGRIVDLLVDRTGGLRAAVIDFGGFFGVGSRKIAVEWHSLQFKRDEKSDTIVAELPPAQLRTAPVYKEGEPVVVLGRAPEPAAQGEAKPAAPGAAPPATPPVPVPVPAPTAPK